jgi:hypothetical protein
MSKDTDKKPEPFIGSTQRHDLTAQLARGRLQAIDDAINGHVAQGLNPKPGKPKIDGKNGALDAQGGLNPGDIASLPWYFPNPPPKEPKGKETKEGKEQKDGKEDKEGKESKDAKEGGKDSSDADKFGADEGSVFKYGEPFELNWSGMNAVAQTHFDRLNRLLAGKKIL